jgi:hypothetical protein
MNKWEQFSHTTRTFLMDPVSESFINWVKETVVAHENDLDYWTIVTDQDIIKSIYDLTEIPDETDVGVKVAGRIGKKNSQVLAPFLLILIPDELEPKSNFTAGWLQSQIGLRAIEEGYSTGFCICVDHKKLSVTMKENNLWDSAVLEVLENRPRTPVGCTTVLFSIGTADPEFKYNYSKIEQREIKSTAKVHHLSNIKIAD